jgi:hypothetical protein
MTMRLLFIILTALGLVGTGILHSRKTAPLLPKVGPVSYFDDHCARCHGPQGSFYGDDFGKNLNEEALRKVVYDMCRHQGDAPLDGVDLDAQIAYHRSMIAKEPFVAVTKCEGGQLSGEVTEKAVVTVKFRHSSVKAEVKGATWKATAPKGEKPTDAVITAELDKRSATLPLSKASFSQSAPRVAKKGEGSGSSRGH